MKQFDAPKKKKTYDKHDNPSDDEMGYLTAVLEELDNELEDDGDDNYDGWKTDMHADMTDEEIEKLEECVEPVRRVLTKVSILRNI